MAALNPASIFGQEQGMCAEAAREFERVLAPSETEGI